MDVYDFCMLCTNDSVEVAIYDFDGEETVFNGTLKEAMDSDFADYEVQSFDLNFNDRFFCLNIDMEDDEE